MKKLDIVWQRLVSADGRTCERCGATFEEVQHAVSTLREVLRPLDIGPVLETREIDDATFRANPTSSNQIFVQGQPVEDWLKAAVGASRCCSVCGDTECRTIEFEDDTFETTPARLVVRAALVAASELIE